MALVLANRVQESATANTTVSFTLTGAIAGFQSFAVIGDTNTTFYSATDGSGNWEVGLGTYSTTGPTLTRTTIYASSNSNLAVTFSGAVNVFVTYPSGRSVNLDASGNVSALGTVSSGTWQGSTVGVAYGGTGVTTSSGANSVVLRDANSNITVNRVSQANTSTTAAGGTTALTAASSYIHTLVGTGGQTYTLPDATTLTTGVAFLFNNMATGTLTVQNYATGSVGTFPSGGAGAVFLTDNSTTGGTWDIHAYLPEGVTFGTNAFNLGSSVISGGTWQGGTIQPGYGGTGLTTFVGANNALYSTGASTLTAGTLPVAAGGTGRTTYTLNGVLYASGTGTLTNGSALTFDGSRLFLGTTAVTTSSSQSGEVYSTGAAGFLFTNTTAANYPLSVKNEGTSGTRNLINFYEGTAGGTPRANISFDGSTNLTVASASSLIFSPSSTEQARLTSSGLLINTTSAVSGSKLVVASADATIYGITVGRGAGAVSTNTAVGENALQANTSGASNAGFGYRPLFSNTSGSYNTAVGQQALQANTTASGSTAVGYQAGYSNTTGTATVFGYQAGYSSTTAGYSVAVGYQALYSNSTGDNNTAVGREALNANTTASNNTAVGYLSLWSNTTGSFNTAVGKSALAYNTIAINNTAVGGNAGANITTGSYNVAIGQAALATSNTGANNVAVGYQTLYLNTTANDNTAVGLQAGYSTTTGSLNSFFGSTAGYSNTTGTNNTAIGRQALYFNTTASNNTAVGYQAGYANTTGEITAFGYTAGYSNTTGTLNTAIGQSALYTNSTGARNTAVGRSALQNSTTAGDNTGIGFGASNAVTTGQYNTSLGSYALYSNTTASNNVAVGYQALLNNTASDNIAVGWQAGYSNTTGTRNTFVGRQAGYSNFTGTRCTYLGFNAGQSASGSYNTFIGNDAGLSVSSGTYNNFLGTLAGSLVTTGSKNTVVGAYNGNQGGLDIRIADNYIVLSDGDGNPRAYWNGANATFNGSLSVSSSFGNIAGVRGSGFGYSPGGYGALVIGATSGNVTPCFNVDPSGNASGSFSGTGNEVMFRNGFSIITPNSANNGYHNYVTMTSGVANFSATLQRGGNTVLDASNYTSYSPSLTGSGASGTWGISITGNAATATTASALTTGNSYQVGSLGVGTAASGTTGEIRATNNITAYYSDDRLKNKLGKIENALDKLCSLEGFYYEANETAQALGYEVKREVGVSAQAVQAVMPEIVAPAPIDEQYLTVRYERALPLVIEAIKELRAEIAEIKKVVIG